MPFVANLRLPIIAIYLRPSSVDLIFSIYSSIADSGQVLNKSLSYIPPVVFGRLVKKYAAIRLAEKFVVPCRLSNSFEPRSSRAEHSFGTGKGKQFSKKTFFLSVLLAPLLLNAALANCMICCNFSHPSD